MKNPTAWRYGVTPWTVKLAQLENRLRDISRRRHHYSARKIYRSARKELLYRFYQVSSASVLSMGRQGVISSERVGPFHLPTRTRPFGFGFAGIPAQVWFRLRENKRSAVDRRCGAVDNDIAGSVDTRDCSVALPGHGVDLTGNIWRPRPAGLVASRVQTRL